VGSWFLHFGIGLCDLLDWDSKRVVILLCYCGFSRVGLFGVGLGLRQVRMGWDFGVLSLGLGSMVWDV